MQDRFVGNYLKLSIGTRRGTSSAQAGAGRGRRADGLLAGGIGSCRQTRRQWPSVAAHAIGSNPAQNGPSRVGPTPVAGQLTHSRRAMPWLQKSSVRPEKNNIALTTIRNTRSVQRW